MKKFKIDNDKKLFYLQKDSWLSVKLEPCFPLSNPESFFSIRTDKNEEVLLFEDVKTFSKEDQKILNSYLSFKNFQFNVVGIYSIEEDFGVRNFKVQTTIGDRSFQTELDEWPERSKDGTISISDLYGERFAINSLDFGESLLKPYV